MHMKSCKRCAIHNVAKLSVQTWCCTDLQVQVQHSSAAQRVVSTARCTLAQVQGMPARVLMTSTVSAPGGCMVGSSMLLLTLPLAAGRPLLLVSACAHVSCRSVSVYRRVSTSTCMRNNWTTTCLNMADFANARYVMWLSNLAGAHLHWCVAANMRARQQMQLMHRLV